MKGGRGAMTCDYLICFLASQAALSEADESRRRGEELAAAVEAAEGGRVRAVEEGERRRVEAAAAGQELREAEARRAEAEAAMSELRQQL